jgi:alkylation response protein AidB-like acyl-CoA dehydrogenase
MEFEWSDEDQQFRKELRAFVDAEIPEEWREHPIHRYPDTPAELARVCDFTRKLAERSWLTPHWPKEYGGSEASAWQHLVLGEELWSVGEPRGSQYMSVNWIGPAIMAFGTPEQKDEHLGRITRGEAFWCQGFSEPDAGSDLVRMKTRAVRDGDEYVVNGSKIWTSHLPPAEWCFLLVRTDPEARPHKGITVLMLRTDSPGFESRRIPNVAGEGSFAEVFLTDVRVPVSQRLGEENDGWRIVRQALQFERIGSPRYQRAQLVLEQTQRYAQEHGLMERPQVRLQLARARAAVEAARHMVWTVVDERAKQLPASALAYAARLSVVRAEREVAEVAVCVAGRNAVDASSLSAHNYFHALTAGLAAGSYEVNLNLVSTMLLGLPKGA